MVSLELEKVKKILEDNKGNKKLVLADVSFHVKKNEFCCVLGPSGCGKTTLLNLIAGIIKYEDGKISFDTDNKENLKIGYVFQQHRLLPWKTVRDNLYFALLPTGIRKDEIEERTTHYLKIVGLYDKKYKFPLFLSEGEKFRVSIARALCIEPDIILMDEPFSHLDEITARSLRKELLKIWRMKKKTVIFVTHNPREAAYLSNKIIVLSSSPARVIGEIKVKENYPREYESKRQIAIEKEILHLLEKN